MGNVVITRVNITPEQVKTYQRALEKTRQRTDQAAHVESTTPANGSSANRTQRTA
ncbi:MAG: hypothetical protein ABSC31_12855 [Acidimicrobiales bacterium]|jgi:hypothetical protein